MARGPGEVAAHRCGHNLVASTSERSCGRGPGRERTRGAARAADRSGAGFPSRSPLPSPRQSGDSRTAPFTTVESAPGASGRTLPTRPCRTHGWMCASGKLRVLLPRAGGPDENSPVSEAVGTLRRRLVRGPFALASRGFVRGRPWARSRRCGAGKGLRQSRERELLPLTAFVATKTSARGRPGWGRTAAPSPPRVRNAARNDPRPPRAWCQRAVPGRRPG